MSKEWVELDRGSISREAALQAIYSRNPGKETLLKDHSDFMKVLTPIEQNTDLLKKLKKRGFNLYYLTNYHSDLFQKTFQKYDFFRFFNGGIVSAAVKLIKPDPAIFSLLMEKYALKADECLYIDDSKKNTEAARKLGIQSIHLKKPGGLKKDLSKVTGLHMTGVL
ncbi:MAG: HAD-IA family hydrolase [Spirochaetaceae bacterium]|nr:HAD-IA family hydrolase [Spirochaetaceae bacterium]